MLIKMLRTQKTNIGLLAAGVAYDLDDKIAAQRTVAERLLKMGFAEKTTKKALDAQAEVIAAQQAADQADAKSREGVPSALAMKDLEKAKAQAAEAVASAQKSEAEAIERAEKAEAELAAMKAAKG